jgi:hypothetical protein
VFGALTNEGVRIQRKLVIARLIDAAAEAIRREIAEGMGAALVRYKNVAQLAAKQFGVEMVVGLLQPGIRSA